MHAAKVCVGFSKSLLVRTKETFSQEFLVWPCLKTEFLGEIKVSVTKLTLCLHSIHLKGGFALTLKLQISQISTFNLQILFTCIQSKHRQIP